MQTMKLNIVCRNAPALEALTSLIESRAQIAGFDSRSKLFPQGTTHEEIRQWDQENQWESPLISDCTFRLATRRDNDIDIDELGECVLVKIPGRSEKNLEADLRLIQENFPNPNEILVVTDNICDHSKLADDRFKKIVLATVGALGPAFRVVTLEELQSLDLRGSWVLHDRHAIVESKRGYLDLPLPSTHWPLIDHLAAAFLKREEWREQAEKRIDSLLRKFAN